MENQLAIRLKMKRLKKINEIFKYNDESAHNMELAETASICGCAYELLYLDEMLI